MTADTLWQKYIYNTPFDDDGLPLLNSRLSEILKDNEPYIISGKALFTLSEADFDSLCFRLSSFGFNSIFIENDYELKSNNIILKKGVEAHLKAFCRLFQDKGFHCRVESLFGL